MADRQESESDESSLLDGSTTDFDGDSSYESASEVSSQVAVDAKLPMSPDQAAAIIQGMYRRQKAREYFLERIRQAYEKVYDEETDTYFYFNKLKGTSHWISPKSLRGRPLDHREESAARIIQLHLRKKRAWGRLLAMLNDVYEKEYDPDTECWFYVNKVTKETRWEKPALFGDKEPPTNTSDVALFRKGEEIKELKEALEKERKDAEEVRKALEEKIIEERVRNGEMDPDEAKDRSRHMSEWDVDTVVAWFHSIGYKSFDKSLREHQVDGLLLLHLMNEDWTYLGITSPLAIRRIDVAMQPYRLRFEQKQAGGGDAADDLSDMSASDTPSDLLDEEENYEDDDSDNRDERVESDEDSMGERELEELRQDELNIHKEIIFEGEDTRGRPSPGDIVRMHYTCSLPAAADSGPAAERAAAAAALRGHKTTPVAGVVAGDAAAGGQGTVVENSRKNRRRPLEFVVGEKQVVKGIDRVIMTMLYGERAKVTVTAGYAYGDKGYPPIVPPRSPLVFDLNLLNFWPRPRWQKPLVQVLSEPYREVPYARREPVAEIVEEDSVAADVPYGKWRK